MLGYIMTRLGVSGTNVLTILLIPNVEGDVLNQIRATKPILFF